MDRPVGKGQNAATSRSLRDAIRKARLEEAEEIDGSLDFRMSELTRLEVLKAALEREFEDIPPGEDRFQLALVPSDPARLWIDMFAYVTIESSGEVYRFVVNGRRGREVIVESRDVGLVTGRVTEYMARQIVARERQLAGVADMPRRAPSRGRRLRVRVGLAISAYIIGILTGVVGLLAIAWIVTR